MALLAVAFAVGNAAAQSRQCGSSSTLISGRVIDAQSRRPEQRRGVSLLQADRLVCMTLTDTAGRFEFRGVAPGQYQLKPGSLGFRKSEPHPVAVSERDSVALEIRLVPGSHFDDCLAKPACAKWLQPSRARGATDDQQFELAALRTAVALSWKPLDKPLEHYFCFDASPVVARAFQRLYPKQARRGECEIGDASGLVRKRFRHVATGSIAYQLEVSRIEVSDSNTRTADVAFHVAPLWAEGWTCRFSRDKGGWRAIECRMRWIS